MTKPHPEQSVSGAVFLPRFAATARRLPALLAGTLLAASWRHSRAVGSAAPAARFCCAPRRRYQKTLAISPGLAYKIDVHRKVSTRAVGGWARPAALLFCPTV